MAANHHYRVTLFGIPFSSLEDAKFNVSVSFTREEAKKFLKDENICHFIVGDRLHSVTPVYVDEHGNISFGKTRKL